MAKKISKKTASKKAASTRAAPKTGVGKTAKAPPARKVAARKKSGPSPERLQEEAYAKAVLLFNRGRFVQAFKRFEEAVKGPALGLRHRAGVYVNICKQRTESAKLRLQTGEDHYNYGVQLVNDRNLEDARKHLLRALKGNKRAGHVHYALAVASSLSGDADGAYESLAAAIQGDAKYRIQAKGDSDFGAVASDPRVAELLGVAVAPAADDA